MAKKGQLTTKQMVAEISRYLDTCSKEQLIRFVVDMMENTDVEKSIRIVCKIIIENSGIKLAEVVKNEKQKTSRAKKAAPAKHQKAPNKNAGISKRVRKPVSHGGKKRK
jgi:hypothetical protein